MVVATPITPMIKEGGNHKAVAPPRYEYILGEILTMDGIDIAGTLPAGTDTIYLRSRGGDAYWNINFGAASGVNSAGFTPENWVEVIGPIVNLNSINFYGAVGVFVHIHYMNEVW